jgi:hypothetical protein
MLRVSVILPEVHGEVLFVVEILLIVRVIGVRLLIERVLLHDIGLLNFLLRVEGSSTICIISSG